MTKKITERDVKRICSKAGKNSKSCKNAIKQFTKG